MIGPTETERVLPVGPAARVLNREKADVVALIQTGELRAFSLGQVFVVPVSALAEFIADQSVNAEGSEGSLTPDEVAVHLPCTTSEVLRLIDRGVLPAVQRGGTFVVPEGALYDFIGGALRQTLSESLR